jgi:hypothetical protein
MKYYLDTEFIEDFTRPLIGKPRHYIDLISIAIVAEDGREYFAVSSEFDVDHVWNKYQLEDKPIGNPGPGERQWQKVKKYWLRDNVLMPIFHRLFLDDIAIRHHDGKHTKIDEVIDLETFKTDPVWSKDLHNFKLLIKKHGKTNKQIAQEIVRFVMPGRDDVAVRGMDFGKYKKVFRHPEFYGYYADYDWVLFCSLYGRMLDLPKGFPMYMRDLKQMLDESQAKRVKLKSYIEDSGLSHHEQHAMVSPLNLKDHELYPKQTNSHHALDDARWNKKLHEFLKTV